jgi:hypothetical protein
MSRQLTHLIALGLADWFADDVDDARFCEINNLDDSRVVLDPFELVAAARVLYEFQTR